MSSPKSSTSKSNPSQRPEQPSGSKLQASDGKAPATPPTNPNDPLNSQSLEGFAPLLSFEDSQKHLTDAGFTPLPSFEESVLEPFPETSHQYPETNLGDANTASQPEEAPASPELKDKGSVPAKPPSKDNSKNKLGKVAKQRAQATLRKSFWQHFPEQVQQLSAKAIAPVWSPVEGAVAKALSKLSIERQAQVKKAWESSSAILLTTLVVTSSLTVLRQVGLFQSAELWSYDFMIRQRPSAGIDDRLLIVAVTEMDIRRLGQSNLDDQTYADLFTKLQAHDPSVIGLDIWRDIPFAPGTEALHEQFKQPNVIAIEKTPTLLDPVGVAPPPIAEEQIGFNDVILDPDNSLRRGLLLQFNYGDGADDETAIQYSFAYRLALFYLKQQGIEATNIPGSDFGMALGEARIDPLTRNSGGYQNLDDGGYQVLLNYRAAFAEEVATTVSVSDVLDGKLQPEQVKNKIVLIGTTAPSLKDYFYTPFTKSRKGGLDMPGVVTHAQFVSQLVDSALGDRPMIGFWPEWLELAWLTGAIGLGALLTTLMKHPLQLLAAQVGGVSLLSVIHWLLFLQYTWVPMVLPLVGLIASSIATVAYSNYRIQQEQKLLAKRAEEQEQAILMLKMASRKNAKPNTIIQAPKAIQTEGFLAERYKIKKVLASGGFGVTYVAQDMRRPGAPECVVKQLRPTIQDPQFLKVARRLFKTEAEILEIVGRHDRIPQLLAYFEDGKDFYLVEDLIDGTPLGDRLPQDRRLSDKVVFKMLREMLPTLAFIHERHIIHRDIKPNNIIHRPSDDALVLIDFGAVKQIQPNLSEIEADKTIAIGTQGYAAPEQLAGHPRINSDIYALGVIAIRALTGVPPHMMEQDPNTGDLSWFQYARCNRRLAKVVHRMSRYHFAERYATADEALRDLLALL